MRLGINTMVWTGRFDSSRLALLDRIRAWGYESVELAIFDFDSVDTAALRRALASSGLAATVSSALPPGLSVAAADPAVRRKTREWLAHAADQVASIGASILAGPMYLPVGELPGRRRTEDEWQRAVDEYRALDRLPVPIALEPLNRFETYFLNTAADARRFCEQVGGRLVGVLLDTFHANIEEEDLAAAFRSLGPHLIHVHLSENHRGIPGCGHVPFAAVLAALAAMRYDGCAVVESFAASIPEIAAATAMWRDYAASPDEFAQRSIAYLRPLICSEEKTS